MDTNLKYSFRFVDDFITLTRISRNEWICDNGWNIYSDIKYTFDGDWVESIQFKNKLNDRVGKWVFLQDETEL